MQRRTFLTNLAMGVGTAVASAALVTREEDDSHGVEQSRWRSSVLMGMSTGAVPVRWSAQGVTGRSLALTFDDGPTEQFTPALLDRLDRLDVRATFFVIGALVDAHPDLVRRAADSGHEIANHTYDHHSAAVQSAAQVQAGVLRCSDAIERVIGTRPRWLRPPRGEITTATLLAARHAGLEVALWSVNRGNGPDGDSASVAASLKSEIRPGAIVGLHDGIGRSSFAGHPDAGLIRRRTAELTALPDALSSWQAQGYSFHTLTDLTARATDRPVEASTV